MAAAACLLALLLALATHSTLAVGRSRATVPRARLRAAAAAGAASTAAGASAVLNAAGQPLLTPTKLDFQAHELYLEAPAGTPRGLVLLLHKCGRSASDFWPRSAACPKCSGLPHSLAMTKQALARGYAVAALSSADRRTGGGARCFQWGADAPAAAAAAQELPHQLGLPAGAPVYAMGTSSGGSLALRLPRLARLDGVVGQVIAPVGFEGLLQEMEAGGRQKMPPALYIHMPRDAGMVGKVAENMAALRNHSVPVGEIQVLPSPVPPAFFSDCSPLVSPGLSARLHEQLRRGGFLDGGDNLMQDLKNSEWAAFRSYLAQGLAADLAALQPQQAEQDAPLLAAHVWECLGVAWAQHETVGEYATAALLWLESGGSLDAAELANAHRVAHLASLDAAPAVGGQDGAVPPKRRRRLLLWG